MPLSRTEQFDLWRYIAQRFLVSIPVVIMVGIITFTLVYVGPGDPAAIIAGDEATPVSRWIVWRAPRKRRWRTRETKGLHHFGGV
jgi:ABC-type dipeptide/oligopeptide/nickel transport system permease component